MSVDSAYVDTSVLGAYYCLEELSTAAEDAVRKLSLPVISNLCELEFHSLISRKRRLRELSAKHAAAVLDLFSTHVAEGFYQRLSLDNAHFVKARQLLAPMNSPLRTLDALHLAAATLASVPLLTADRALLKVARQRQCATMLVK